MTAETRQEFLDQVAQAVCQDRNTTYGEPEDSFKTVADYWNIHLGLKDYIDIDNRITSKDVGIMLALLKVARLKNNPSHTDSYIDLAGYAACVGAMSMDKQEIGKIIEVSQSYDFTKPSTNTTKDIL